MWWVPYPLKSALLCNNKEIPPCRETKTSSSHNLPQV